MSQVQSFLETYFANDDGKFDPNDHIDKFALIYLGIIFVTCIALRGIGII